jgi:hypothetical protein
MTQETKPMVNPAKRNFSRFSEPNVYLPVLASLFAVLAFVVVILISEKTLGLQITVLETVYAISMGLLGSSLFLLYNLIGAIKEQRFRSEEVGKSLARLLIGPVAGWLSYFMYVTARSEQLSPQEAESVKKIASTTQIWLPFLAGFSSDLLVGLINQGVRAIKFTLGIDRVE